MARGATLPIALLYMLFLFVSTYGEPILAQSIESKKETSETTSQPDQDTQSLRGEKENVKESEENGKISNEEKTDDPNSVSQTSSEPKSVVSTASATANMLNGHEEKPDEILAREKLRSTANEAANHDNEAWMH